MADDLGHRVLPAELPAPPNFSSDVSPWGMGFLFIIVAFFVSRVLVGDVRLDDASDIRFFYGVFVSLGVVAVILAVRVYHARKNADLSGKVAQWKRSKFIEYGDQARELTQRVSNTEERFYSSLQTLPGLLRDTAEYLDNAESEFSEGAYAPFWDNIEQAALRLGAFNESLIHLEAEADTYRRLLSGQTHNFLPLLVRHNDIPNPAPHAERLRQLVRMGQKNFEFATIWEHRKTQQVILEGFRTLGEAVNGLGSMIDGSFSRVTGAIAESSQGQRNEQVKLRLTFGDAVEKWEKQKQLYKA